MSIFNNFPKVAHNIWDKITFKASTSISPFLKKVETDAVRAGEEILMDIGKAVLTQTKGQLGSNAKVGDIIKAAVELGIPMLESKGIAAATALLYNVVSALLISLETHDSAAS